MGMGFVGDAVTGGLWSPTVALQHGQGVGAAVQQSLTLGQAAPPPPNPEAPYNVQAAFSGARQAASLAATQAQNTAANQAAADNTKRSLLG